MLNYYAARGRLSSVHLTIKSVSPPIRKPGIASAIPGLQPFRPSLRFVFPCSGCHRASRLRHHHRLHPPVGHHLAEARDVGLLHVRPVRQRLPGATSRWNRGKDLSWEPLRPEWVAEVAYDHLQGDRFRHGTTFKRFRPDKPPEACRYDQLEETAPFLLASIFGEGG